MVTSPRAPPICVKMANPVVLHYLGEVKTLFWLNTVLLWSILLKVFVLILLNQNFQRVQNVSVSSRLGILRQNCILILRYQLR